jgi:hypothetical protein
MSLATPNSGPNPYGTEEPGRERATSKRLNHVLWYRWKYCREGVQVRKFLIAALVSVAFVPVIAAARSR